GRQRGNEVGCEAGDNAGDGSPVPAHPRHHAGVLDDARSIPGRMVPGQLAEKYWAMVVRAGGRLEREARGRYTCRMLTGLQERKHTMVELRTLTPEEERVI